MKHILLSALALLVACGDGLESVDARGQELVFGARDALQTRTGIKSPQLSIDPNLQGTFQAAMLARGAASVEVKTQQGGGPACPPRTQLGSAQLVGDRTLTTAVHVVDGKSPIIFAAIEGAVRTQDVSYLNSVRHGAWLIDTFKTPPTVDETNDYSDFGTESPSLSWGQFGKPEESPLLAERLFQLSFHGTEYNTDTDPSFNRILNTSTNVRTLRNAWRVRWPFARDFDVNKPWDGLAKNFGRDMTVLLAQDILDTDPFRDLFYNNNLGPLVLNVPAVFFNRSDFQQEVRGVLAELTPDAILLQFQHLRNLPDSYLTAMYSPGRLRKDWNQVTTPLVYCNAFGVQDFASLVATKAELDSLDGSSGGGVLTCDAPGCERWFVDGQQDNRRYATLKTRGVISTVTDYFSSWGSGQPGNDESVYALVTMPTGNEWSSLWPEVEDKYTTCFTKGVNCPSLPACTGSDPTTGACLVWEDGELRENLAFGNPPADPRSIYVDLDYYDGQVVPEEEDESHVGDYTNFEINCNELFKKEQQFDPAGHSGFVHGALIGFRGFSANEPIGGIGTLSPVCSVYDTENYFSNWHAIRTLGPTSPGDNIDNGDNNGRPRYPVKSGFLYRSLNVEFYREHVDEDGDGSGDGQTLNRPKPMKLCPPNHLLAGVDIVKDSNNVVTRIDSLECVAVYAEQNIVRRRMPLWIGENESENYQYTVQGTPYTLSQRIGTRNSANANAATSYVGCDNDEVAYRVQMTYNGQGRVNGLFFGCMPNPQLATP
ncbi:MAG: hypothetical protein R3E66_17510 [bacterium]